MKLSLSSITNILLILTATSLSGCQTVDVRGQHVSDSAVKEINDKKLTEEEVMELIGSPTYVPEYTKNTWYYIQRSSSKKAWFDPKVKEQRIVKITFHNGKAQNAQLLTGTQNESLMIESSMTKSRGTEQNGVQKFVKNIGRFNKTTDGKKKK